MRLLKGDNSATVTLVAWDWWRTSSSLLLLVVVVVVVAEEPRSSNAPS